MPRDKDGRITHWIDGMDPCKCGGKHLYRDCDQESSATAKPAGVTDALDSLTKEQIAEQIQAYLGGNLDLKTAGVCALIEPDDQSEMPATEEWCAAASRARLSLPRGSALPLTAPAHCVHRSVTNATAESPWPSVGSSLGTVERVSGSSVFTHELVPVNVNSMYGVNVPKAAAAGSPEPRPCNRERHERGRNPSGVVHMNENHHPSASFQSVTSWCRPCPANRGHMKFPPGLNIHEISGTPPVGPAPDGYSLADTSGLHLEINGSSQVDQIADSTTDHRISDDIDRYDRPYGRTASRSHSRQAALSAAATGGKSDTARSGSTTPAVRAIASLFGLAHPDSGCTGSITPDEKSLINRRPCSDTFRAANKKLAKATCIGDLPAVVVRKDGARACRHRPLSWHGHTRSSRATPHSNALDTYKFLAVNSGGSHT